MRLLIRIRSENRPTRVKLRFEYDHIAPSGFGVADQEGTDSYVLFLFKHRSYSNQREHSCRYPFDRHTAELIRGLLGRIQIIAQPLLRTDVDHIRISVVKQLSRSFVGFLFKHRSYLNQRDHSCRYPLDRHRQSHWGLYDRIRILA